MAYKQPSSGAPFKQMGSSPAKQSIDFWNQTPEEYAKYQKNQKIDHVKRTTDNIHSIEKKIGELKESRAKDIKKVKGNFVEISKKAIREQMKKAGTKIPYSSIKNALKTSIKAAGKIPKFVPGVAGFLASKSAGVAGLVLGATETAKADQPTKGKGKVEYPGGKIDFKSEK
jgi:hypothetical protein